MKTELLYLHVKNYDWYEKLELSFSNEFEFVEKDDAIAVIPKNAVNLFEKRILNLTTLVGNNGVGKSTILRTIFKLVNTTRHKALTMVIKHEGKILIHSNENGLKFSKEALDLLGEKYGGEQDSTIDIPIQVGLFSHTLDQSLPDDTKRIRNNKHFNFTPTSLINQPENFLDYSLKSNASLLNNVGTYYIIDKIHQIQVIQKEGFKFLELRQTPDQVEIQFNGLDIEEAKRKATQDFKDILKRFSNDNTLISIIKWQAFVKFYHMFENYRQLTKKGSKDEFIKYYLNLIEKTLLSTISWKEVEVLVTKIINQFSEGREDEQEEFKREISDIGKVLGKLSEMVEGKVDFKFHLEDAAEFLKNMLILVGSIGDFLGNLLPTKITYLVNNKQFYFSTGEEQMIRLATYINLAYESIIHSSEQNAPETLILLIDEPDNGLNPQAQKRVINQLNEYLQTFEDIFFQVIMTTHSPIITSDLTSNHLQLFERSSDGRSIQALRHSHGKKQTFAENIHRLYKHAFFINDGLLGNFADKRLMELYEYLDKGGEDSHYSRYTQEQLAQLVSEISEPLIRMKFEEKINKEKKFQKRVQELLKEQLTDEGLKKSLEELLEKEKDND